MIVAWSVFIWRRTPIDWLLLRSSYWFLWICKISGMLQISCGLNKKNLTVHLSWHPFKNHLALVVWSLLTSSCECHHHATCGQSPDYQSLRQGCKKGSKGIKTKLSKWNSLSCHVSVVTLQENANGKCSCWVENNRQLKLLNDFFPKCNCWETYSRAALMGCLHFLIVSASGLCMFAPSMMMRKMVDLEPF